MPNLPEALINIGCTVYKGHVIISGGHSLNTSYDKTSVCTFQWWALLILKVLEIYTYNDPKLSKIIGLKGQCHEIFDFFVFFMNQFPPSP
jgi:hypothetical protein